MKTTIKFLVASITTLALYGGAQAEPSGKGLPGSDFPKRGGVSHAAIPAASCADYGAGKHAGSCPANGTVTCSTGCKKSLAPVLGGPRSKRLMDETTTCVNSYGRKCRM